MINERTMIKKEYDNLRDELHNLKQCQVTFLTASITATGLILTVAAKINNDPLPGIVYLFPLAILIPSWFVFFDKATTITRIVGYYRVLENIFTNQSLQSKYIGWENSLKKFREEESGVDIDDVVNADASYFSYWSIVFAAYFVLSLFCILLSLFTIYINQPLQNTIIIAVISSTILIFSFYLINKILKSLIKGRHSYNANEKIWREILLR